jgi:hypothetical protein
MLLHPKHQATLLVSPSYEATATYIENTLQKLWCTSNEEACGCSECRMLKNRTHPRVIWIFPEQGYKIEHIQPLLHLTQFSRTADDPLVFVIDKAETLTNAVANRLLITLEEPPEGYYFIIATLNLDLILPTIVSRCMLHTITEKSYFGQELPKICQIFTGIFLPDQKKFDWIMKTEYPDHRASRHYFDIIRAIHIQELKKHYDHQTSRAKKYKIIETLNQFAHRLPSQGNARFFWKLLYLAWPR